MTELKNPKVIELIKKTAGTGRNKAGFNWKELTPHWG